MLECVVNVSEGRRRDVVRELVAAAAAAGPVLDVHTDADHHRSVLTLVGEDAPRALAAAAVERLDLRDHTGVHPRLGVIDVVPFVPLAGCGLDDAVAARNSFAEWAAAVLRLPCFLFGPERSLPEVRRSAFASLAPDAGPDRPHLTAGAVCVGARPVLVAYNVWLAPGVELEDARRVAAELRGPSVRALAFRCGERVQVSTNLLDPLTLGPAEAYDAVAGRAEVAGAELVGLVPEAVVAAVPRDRWAELDLDPSRTIEARLRAAGLGSQGSDGGGTDGGGGGGVGGARPLGEP